LQIRRGVVICRGIVIIIVLLTFAGLWAISAKQGFVAKA